eukprot:1050926-Rhodomonas_salina.2
MVRRRMQPTHLLRSSLWTTPIAEATCSKHTCPRPSTHQRVGISVMLPSSAPVFLPQPYSMTALHFFGRVSSFGLHSFFRISSRFTLVRALLPSSSSP